MNDEVDFGTFDDVVRIARLVLPTVSIRDPGPIESAVARPQTTVLGAPAYPTIALHPGSSCSWMAGISRTTSMAHRRAVTGLLHRLMRLARVQSSGC